MEVNSAERLTPLETWSFERPSFLFRNRCCSDQQLLPPPVNSLPNFNLFDSVCWNKTKPNTHAAPPPAKLPCFALPCLLTVPGGLHVCLLAPHSRQRLQPRAQPLLGGTARSHNLGPDERTPEEKKNTLRARSKTERAAGCACVEEGRWKKTSQQPGRCRAFKKNACKVCGLFVLPYKQSSLCN